MQDNPFAAWPSTVNRAAATLHVAEPAVGYRLRGKPPVQPALLTRDEARGDLRMAHEVAEALVNEGLDPDYIGTLAAASGIEPRELYEFTGIDRTTVARRKAAGAALPHEAAVKALQATELLALAHDVFGGPAPAARWLTQPHPLLARAEGGEPETPLRRARTPWGLAKVQGMLVALRHGGAA